MSLHLNSITDANVGPCVLSWLVKKGMDEYDSIFVTDDGKYFHIGREMFDAVSGDKIGSFIFTIKKEGRSLQMLDLDLVLNNDTPTLLKFDSLRPGSSDAKQYYNAVTVDTERHLELETVNHHVKSGELSGRETEAYISVFPFELRVYKDIDAFFEHMGHISYATAESRGEREHRLSEGFIMPGGLFNSRKQEDESYSLLLGRVLSMRDVSVVLGDVELSFVLAKVDTALGNVPMAMGREVFDLSSLRIGSIVAMNASVNADVAKYEDFEHPRG